VHVLLQGKLNDTSYSKSVWTSE